MQRWRKWVVLKIKMSGYHSERILLSTQEVAENEEARHKMLQQLY